MPMRVLAVADVYEALISERPYRPAYTPKVALELMATDVPARLDPDAFAALKSLVADRTLRSIHGRLTGARRPLRRIR
jgi:HD-GYP domain-containing protein (c-di-GMP phosphodiesterase class II)